MIKRFHSPDFNYFFDGKTGYTAVWGKRLEDDPECAPFPMIADIEITTICNGIGNYGPCPFCYKSNTAKGEYMPFDIAKKVIDKLPKELTQIAFGVDAKLESNPDWYKIFKYAREKTFVPNVTVADVNEETAKKIASVCGAVAVSRYADKNICYDTVKRLTDEGMQQVNIHCMASKNTLEMLYETIDDIRTDKRLEKLNAIVFLSLKRKGRGKSYTSLSSEEFAKIVKTCMKYGIRYGFDSCSGHKFLSAIRGTVNEKLAQFCTPCESTRESCYINVRGEYFPCSFTEGTPGWEKGIDVINCSDFINDVWQNPRTHNFREVLLMNDCRCPVYNV